VAQVCYTPDVCRGTFSASKASNVVTVGLFNEVSSFAVVFAAGAIDAVTLAIENFYWTAKCCLRAVGCISCSFAHCSASVAGLSLLTNVC